MRIGGQAIAEGWITSGMLCTAMASAMTAPKSVKAEKATWADQCIFSESDMNWPCNGTTPGSILAARETWRSCSGSVTEGAQRSCLERQVLH